MVGFSVHPTIKEEEQVQDQENLKKSEDPLLDFQDWLPESEDFSSSFIDSLLDFNDWIEGKPDPLSDFDNSMTDSGVEAVVKCLEAKSNDGVGLAELEVAEKSISFDTGDGFQKNVGVLGLLIEEEMGKVTLENVECESEKKCDAVGGVESSVVVSAAGNENEVENGEKLVQGDEEDLKSGGGVQSDEEEDSDEDSESESLSSSSSSSSSTSDEEEEEEDEVEAEKEIEGKEEELEMEEGEIRDLVVDDLAAWSDDEGGVATGPIRSKNEVQDLPPVPPVNVSILPHHQILPVGVVLSMIGAQVIVEGVEKHNPLSEGSILWITESRSPLGIVDEIFGPVKNPYYIVRYNSESEVPSGIHQGSMISFVPEFADYVLNNSNLYKKGYDASGENDEELTDELEFSDDEKEAEYRRMQKMTKRATNGQKSGNIKSERKKFKNQGGNRKNNDHQVAPTLQTQQGTVQQPQGGMVQQPPNAKSPRPHVQGYPAGPSSTPLFQPVPQAANFAAPSSGAWTSGIPSVPPQSMGMGFPNGFLSNMAWLQQNFQMPLASGAQFHQQFNTGQMVPANIVLQGQPNFFAGQAFSPWPAATMGQNGFNQPQFPTGFPGQVAPSSMNSRSQFPMGFPGQVAASSMTGQPQFPTGFLGQVAPQSMNVLQQGVVPNGPQVDFTNGMRPPFSFANSETAQNSNQGEYSDRGGRQPFRGRGRSRGGGGGRFRGRRGGRQHGGRS